MTVCSFEVLAGSSSEEIKRVVPNEEMSAVLDLIASQIQENYELIDTWSGEIEKKITWLHTGSVAENILKNNSDVEGAVPEAVLQKVEDEAKFTVDAQNNFVYIDTFRDKPSEYLNYDTGATIGNSGKNKISSTVIAKPDFILKAEPYSFEKETGNVIHKRARKTTSKLDFQGALYQGRYDPRKAFFPSGEFTWDNLKYITKKLDAYGKIEFDGYRFQIEECKRGEVIEYKIIQPSVVSLERSSPEHYIVLTKIFSSQYNLNMICWEATSGNGTPLQKYTWDYEVINGVYLPKRVTIKIYGLNGEVTDEYDSIYKNNKVNPKVLPEKFEYTNLGLKDGDIFVDEIMNKEYRFEAATKELKPIEK